MGFFSRKEDNKPKPKDNRMQHCLKYDTYFILMDNECEGCQIYDECQAYEDHRDFEDGELFFTFVNKRPISWTVLHGERSQSLFARISLKDSQSLLPADFKCANGKTVTGTNEQLQRYKWTMCTLLAERSDRIQIIPIGQQKQIPKGRSTRFGTTRMKSFHSESKL